MKEVLDLLKKQNKGLDTICKDLTDMKVTVAKQEVNLKAHHRRTTLLEDSVGMLRREFNPIKTHVAVMSGIAKALIIILGIAGTIAGIIRAFI